MVVLILRDGVGFWKRHWGCRGPRNHLAKKMVIKEGCRCMRRDSYKCLYTVMFLITLDGGNTARQRPSSAVLAFPDHQAAIHFHQLQKAKKDGRRHRYKSQSQTHRYTLWQHFTHSNQPCGRPIPRCKKSDSEKISPQRYMYNVLTCII